MGLTFRALVPILLLALVGAALAVPMLPEEFSGTVTIDDKKAPAGTVVTATIDGQACGSFTLKEAGTFGGDDLFAKRLIVSGDESDVEKTITFSVGEKTAEKTATYTPGASCSLDLTVKSGTTSNPGNNNNGGSHSGGGGGGGGGGGAPQVQPPAPVMEYTGHASLDLDADGAARFKTVVSTTEKNASLVIDEGVKSLNRFGRSLDAVKVRSVAPDTLPASDDRTAQFGPGLKCEPEGATFDPAVEVKFTLTPEEWERLGDGERFVVRWYNETNGTWEPLATTAHASTRTLTAKVSHFTLFAVFAEEAPAPTPTSTSTVTAADQASGTHETETLPAAPGVTDPAPEQGGSSAWLFGLGALVVVAAGVLFVVMRKREE